MRKMARVFGWVLVVLAALLIVVGITTLPSGGLMFALPYVFFIPGVLLGLTGWALRRIGRERGE